MRFFVVGCLVFASRLGAQAALGSDWIRIRGDKLGYTNLDSIQKLGPEAYRAVLIFESFPGVRDILTSEFRCTDHAARTIRYRTVGRFARRMAQDRKVPDAPFEKPTPGDTADVQARKVCQLAERKFSAAAKNAAKASATPAKSPSGRGSP